jgi:hypothetical protein
MISSTNITPLRSCPVGLALRERQGDLAHWQAASLAGCAHHALVHPYQATHYSSRRSGSRLEIHNTQHPDKGSASTAGCISLGSGSTTASLLTSRHTRHRACPTAAMPSVQVAMVTGTHVVHMTRRRTAANEMLPTQKQALPATSNCIKTLNRSATVQAAACRT